MSRVELLGELHGLLPSVELYPTALNAEAVLTHHTLLTTNHYFYVRNHDKEYPRLNRETYKLSVTGAVNNPLEIDYKELFGLPRHSKTMTLECAGNGRFLIPYSKDRIRSSEWWGTNAVSTARWSGVLLSDVLGNAELRDGASVIRLIGADQVEVDGIKQPYAGHIPVDLLKEREVMLAYEMNGSELPVEHGFPLRDVVPGWYAMRNVKWLTRIEVLTEDQARVVKDEDIVQGKRYYIIGEDGEITVLTEMKPKSITTSALYDGRNLTLRGYAWSGDSRDIKGVEISADQGDTWQRAKLDHTGGPYEWRLWSFDDIDVSGQNTFEIFSRALGTDGRGFIPLQPEFTELDAEHNPFGYINNGWRSHGVKITVLKTTS